MLTIKSSRERSRWSKKLWRTSLRGPRKPTETWIPGSQEARLEVPGTSSHCTLLSCDPWLLSSTLVTSSFSEMWNTLNNGYKAPHFTQNSNHYHLICCQKVFRCLYSKAEAHERLWTSQKLFSKDKAPQILTNSKSKTYIVPKLCVLRCPGSLRWIWWALWDVFHFWGKYDNICLITIQTTMNQESVGTCEIGQWLTRANQSSRGTINHKQASK